MQAKLVVYRAPETQCNFYQLVAELANPEDAFRLWRFRQLTTVARIVGDRSGTGGTEALASLRRSHGL